MTRQAADTIIYEGESYELLGDSSGQLPMVKRYGMQPQCTSTACYKGYVAEYAIIGQQLVLTALMISDATGFYPDIGGIQPSKRGFYEHLSETMPITGVITIGRGEPENWLSGDIRSVHDYVVVLKIILKDGIVQSVEVISQAATAIRVKLQQIIKEREALPGVPSAHPPPLPDEWGKLMDASWALRYSTVDNED